MRHIALTILAAAAISLYSCGGCKTCGRRAGASAQGSPGPGAAETSPTPPESRADSLKVQISLREGGYALLEPVEMTLTVENIAGRDLKLTFPTAQRYDFIVRKGKQVVWKWSEGMMFAQAISREVLPAGGTISYEVTWDQTGAEDMRPPLGTYTVQGILKTAPEMGTEEGTFGIVD